MVRAGDCSFFCWDSLDSLDSPKRSLPTGTSTGTVSGARVSVVVGASRRFPEVAGRTAFSQVMLLGFSMVYRVKKLNLPLELRVFMWIFRLRSFEICGSLGWFEGKSTANGFWPSLLPVIWIVSGMPGDFSKLHDASLSATVGSKHSISNFRIWAGRSCFECKPQEYRPSTSVPKIVWVYVVDSSSESQLNHRRLWASQCIISDWIINAAQAILWFHFSWRKAFEGRELENVPIQSFPTNAKSQTCNYYSQNPTNVARHKE